MLTTAQIIKEAKVSRCSIYNWKKRGLIRPITNANGKNIPSDIWDDMVLEKIKEIQSRRGKYVGRPKKGFGPVLSQDIVLRSIKAKKLIFPGVVVGYMLGKIHADITTPLEFSYKPIIRICDINSRKEIIPLGQLLINKKEEESIFIVSVPKNATLLVIDEGIAPEKNSAVIFTESKTVGFLRCRSPDTALKIIGVICFPNFNGQIY